MTDSEVKAVLDNLGLCSQDMVVETPHITSPEQIQLTEIDLPPHLREYQFDMVLIYADKDVKIALAFKDILEKFIILDDGKNARVCVLDRGDYLVHIGSKFKHLEDAVRRSTYMFLFMTKHFVKDSWAELQGDECLQESIDNPQRRWCVIPIHTVPKRKCNYTVPFGLRALKGVHVDRVFADQKKQFDETIDVKSIEKDDLDAYFIKQMQNLFNVRLREKLEREKRQERQKKNWIKKEQVRCFEKIKAEEKEELLKAEKHKKTLELISQRNAQDYEKRKETIQNMTVEDLELPPNPEPDFQDPNACVYARHNPIVNINFVMPGQVATEELLDSTSTGDVSIHRTNNDQASADSKPESIRMKYSQAGPGGDLLMGAPSRVPEESLDRSSRIPVEHDTDNQNDLLVDGPEGGGDSNEATPKSPDDLGYVSINSREEDTLIKQRLDSMNVVYRETPRDQKLMSVASGPRFNSDVTCDDVMKSMPDRAMSGYSTDKLYFTESGESSTDMNPSLDVKSKTTTMQSGDSTNSINKMKATLQAISNPSIASKQSVGQKQTDSDTRHVSHEVQPGIKPQCAPSKSLNPDAHSFQMAETRSNTARQPDTHINGEMRRAPNERQSQEVGVVLPEQRIHRPPVPNRGTNHFVNNTHAPAYSQQQGQRDAIDGAHNVSGPYPHAHNGTSHATYNQHPQSAHGAFNQPHGPGVAPNSAPGSYGQDPHTAQGAFMQAQAPYDHAYQMAGYSAPHSAGVVLDHTQRFPMPPPGSQSSPYQMGGFAGQPAMPMGYDPVLQQMMMNTHMMYCHRMMYGQGMAPPPNNIMPGFPYSPNPQNAHVAHQTNVQQQYEPKKSTHNNAHYKRSQSEQIPSTDSSISLRPSLYMSDGSVRVPSENPGFKAKLPDQPVSQTIAGDVNNEFTCNSIPETPHVSVYISGNEQYTLRSGQDGLSVPSSGYATGENCRFESIRDTHFEPKIQFINDTLNSNSMSSERSEEEGFMSTSSYGGSTFIPSEGSSLSQTISESLTSTQKSRSERAMPQNGGGNLPNGEVLPDFKALNINDNHRSIDSLFINQSAAYVKGQ